MQVNKIIIAVVICTLTVFGCVKKPVQVAAPTKPYAASNKTYTDKVKAFADTLIQPPVYVPNDSIRLPPTEWIGTTNFNMRKPNFVIIHHTAQNSCEQTFRTFTLTRTQVSAHYVICRDGSVNHMLSDYLRAWHAGISKWGNATDLNSCSIGIELDNNGVEPFDTLQINSLLKLLDTLKKTYNIPTPNFIGHGDIAPIRKNDPSILFPWKLLAEKGFGLWYDAAPGDADSSFNQYQALRIVGYSIKDTTATILAFKRHFMQDTSRIMTNWDKRVLNNLYKKYM